MANGGISLTTYFRTLENAFSIPRGYLQRVAEIESGMNPLAQNPNSSAAGLFQFIESTGQQYGLDNPFDPFQSAAAAARFTRDNFSALANFLGRDPEPWELYLAHQQGAQGAINLLENPDALAVLAIGRDAVINNSGRVMDTSQSFIQRVAGYYLNDTFVGDALAQTIRSNDNVEVELSEAQTATLENYGATIATGIGGVFERGVIIILGFIFVSIGLSMFRTTR